MRHTITIIQDLVASYENSPIRLYYPRFTAAWLGVAPASIIHEEGEQVIEQSDNPAYTDPNDTLENLVSQTSDDGDADSDSLPIPTSGVDSLYVLLVFEGPWARGGG